MSAGRTGSGGRDGSDSKGRAGIGGSAVDADSFPYIPGSEADGKSGAEFWSETFGELLEGNLFLAAIRSLRDAILPNLSVDY